ncbi:hypothetical protein RND71_034802 [Anisodus tanguticus]|uniref:Protein kinase domain-containing protein n=1 Tax=Anisodus tanguticus TaxID=243964 RepID=A0AAE1R3V3_9SOLA|nr:hypothetical protein RND71_034802 [Anisodus tanguticus]
MHHFRGLISKLSFSASGESLKKEHYLKNGSAVLEEFIALCEGKCRIPLRYFSAIEIERATKDAEGKLYICGRYMIKGLLDKRLILVNFTYFNRNSSDICRDIAITSQMSHLKNGNYNDHARNSSVPWRSRLWIANEIASAVVYLHSEFTTPIIYRDLHSQKVLIDQSSGVAKLFDFSFSISLPPGELEVEAQDGVRATGGDIDLEYCRSAIVTQKTDVFGLGNVLFQLLTGKSTYMADGVIRNHDQTFLDSEKCNVMDLADPAILAGESGIHEIRQQLEDYLDLVKRCTASKGEDRPYMIYVAKELRRIEKCFRFEKYKSKIGVL